jgi:hypothetical protein
MFRQLTERFSHKLPVVAKPILIWLWMLLMPLLLLGGKHLPQPEVIC